MTVFVGFTAEATETGKHLFILSGQSNMQRLKPKESFIPAVEKAWGADKVIVVKSAYGGQPIRRWVKNWKPAVGDEPKGTGDLYDRLLRAVREAAGDHELLSVNFLWMHGEQDAMEKHGAVYHQALNSLREQLLADFKARPFFMVVGLLSDFNSVRFPHWKQVRDAQIEFASSFPEASTVTTDDLNDGLDRKGKEVVNDLHYSANGYILLGERLAGELRALHAEAGQSVSGTSGSGVEPQTQ